MRANFGSGTLETIALFARDLVVAAYDLVTGRQQRQYRYELVVQAPKKVVTRLLTASHVIYQRGNTRAVTEPLGGTEGVDVMRYFIGNWQYGSLSVRRSQPRPDTFSWRFLPELSELSAEIGADDTAEVSLEALSNGSTQMLCTRALLHRRAGTRVSAPIGLRQFAWILKDTAEKEVGRAASWSQFGRSFWLIAAIGITFWGMFGLADAAIVILMIVTLELGHAAALLVTGRGVRFFAGVPFFGGMAVPKYPYENEWQRALVALMGPSVCLVPTLAFYWLAYSSHSVLAGRVAFWFAVFNCFNLLPLVPFDGGIVVDVLLRSMRDRLVQVIALVGALAGLALVFYNPFDWAVFVGLIIVGAGLKFAFQPNRGRRADAKELGGFAAPAMFGALALLLFIYWTVAWQISPPTRLRPGFQGAGNQAAGAITAARRQEETYRQGAAGYRGSRPRYALV
jgi:Zn-dependent protease